MRIGKLLLTAVAAVGVTCGSYAAYCGLLIWSGNHHTVAEGQLYRSAQLSGQELGEEIDAHRIRTVLNLRGPNRRMAGIRMKLRPRALMARRFTMSAFQRRNPSRRRRSKKSLPCCVMRQSQFSSIACRALIAPVLSPHSTATPLKDRVRKGQRANYRCATGIFRI